MKIAAFLAFASFLAIISFSTLAAAIVDPVLITDSTFLNTPSFRQQATAFSDSVLKCRLNGAFDANIDCGSIVEENAARYARGNTCPTVDRVALAEATIVAESAGRAREVSSANAHGLMQLIPATAARFGVKRFEIYEPSRNIYAGMAYQDYLLRFFNCDLTKVIAAYNAGEGAVQKYGGVPPFKETRNYVPKVLAYYNSHATSGQTGGNLAA